MQFELAQNLSSLGFFVPEIVLVFALLGVIIADLLAVKGVLQINSHALTLGGLVLCFVTVLNTPHGVPETQTLFHGMITADAFSFFFKLIFLGCGVFLLWMSYGSPEIDPKTEPEYHTILLAMTLGLFLMASSTDLLMIYLSLEFVSILSYVVAGLQPREPRAREAALKYVVFGGAASGIMLYGLSLLYGATGTTNLLEMRAAFEVSQPGLMHLLAIAIMLAGFGYKIAAAPFHMWAPDVYEGSPTPVTAFFSVAPKAAGFAILIRVFATWFADTGDLGLFGEKVAQIIGLMAIATMIIGNLSAVFQTNIKRFLAYSSIAHAGYLLMGVALLPSLSTKAEAADGIRAILIYMVFYVFMNLGAFWVGALVIRQRGSEEISEFQGLGQRAPLAAVSMAIFLFSLAGLPPFAGFVGKFYIFVAVLEQPTAFNVLMVAVAALTTMVAVYYYFRICRLMFFDGAPDDRPVPAPVPKMATALMLVFMIPTVYLGIFWNPMLKAADFGIQIAGLSLHEKPAATATNEPVPPSE